MLDPANSGSHRPGKYFRPVFFRGSDYVSDYGTCCLISTK